MLLGRSTFGDAVDHGDIRLEGTPALVRAFPTWLGVSRFAKYATWPPSITQPTLAAV